MCATLLGCGVEGSTDNDLQIIDTSEIQETEHFTETESFDEDLYYAQAEVHWASFQVGKRNPQITENSTSWYVDLNADGQDERLLFDWGYMDPGSYGIFAVLSNENEVLYVDMPAHCHAGWINYYVYQSEGREYLLRYMPNISTGTASYEYTLYEWKPEIYGLTSDPSLQHKLSVVEHKYVEFLVGPGEDIKKRAHDWVMDINGMVDFAYSINVFLKNSYLLFSTDKDWMREEIQNSENGMFVVGGPETPYLQYENYSMFSSEGRSTEQFPSTDYLYEVLRTWCDTEGIPSIDPDRIWQDYLASYEVGSMAPQITEDSVVWSADLTHDGHPEKVLFDWSQFDDIGEGIFAVLDAQGKVLYSDEVTESHSWLRTYYLCNWEGKEYLFRYDPYTQQGEAAYSYELFYLTERGEVVEADSETICFSVESMPCAANQNGTRVMDIPSMVIFAEKVNGYIDRSFLLVSSDWDWIPQLWQAQGKSFVIGSPDDPYRLKENYSHFEKSELLGLNQSPDTELHEKIKTWCEKAEIPYID